jgi:hypothetical protein
MEDICQLCSLSLQEGDTKCITDKGKASLQAASLERGDGKHETMLTIPPTKVHVTCYKDYTRRTSISSFKRTVPSDKAMTNGNFSDVKLKRNDKVKTIASVANTVTIRNERVTINPAVLFSRITCILRDSSEMEVYLSYELAPQPPSLFQDGLMRKSPKSALGQLLRSKAPLESRFPDDAKYIVDGGYLLRVVIWPANPTYSQVCDSYVSYTERHYGNETIVVFDGYECTTSTKSAEQKRRATKSSSRDIMFDESMQTVTTQSAFLSNDGNKTRLISMLVHKFNDKFIRTRQAAADADRLIVETALSESGQSRPVVVIGTDTDLLVMLISLAPPDCDMYMLCSTNPIALYNITLIQNAVGNKKNTCFSPTQ